MKNKFVEFFKENILYFYLSITISFVFPVLLYFKAPSPEECSEYAYCYDFFENLQSEIFSTIFLFILLYSISIFIKYIIRFIRK